LRKKGLLREVTAKMTTRKLMKSRRENNQKKSSRKV
jgi:hypothetical protein